MPVVARGRAEQQRYFRQLPTDITKVLRGAGRAGGDVVANEAKLRVQSAEVREKVVVEVTANDDHIYVLITVKRGWARSLAIWLEYGTSPHFITVDDAVRGGSTARRINRRLTGGEASLRSTLIINGKPVGKTVHHPGAQPHPFLRPARDIKKAEAIAAAQAYIDAHLRRGVITGRAEGVGA
jgi:hypothetical protein